MTIPQRFLLSVFRLSLRQIPQIVQMPELFLKYSIEAIRLWRNVGRRQDITSMFRFPSFKPFSSFELTHFYRYIIETSVYERLAKYEGSDRQDCFATCFFSGQILCSSVFPEGYIMIFEKRPGIVASTVFDELTSDEQFALIMKLRQGIIFFLECGVTIGCHDPLKNLLLNRGSGLITMVDFVSLTEAGGLEVPVCIA